MVFQATADYFSLINQKSAQFSPKELWTNICQDVVDTNVGDAVVQILGQTGIAGFKFHIQEQERIELDSQITTHYVEDNRPVQDHIAHNPVMITVKGLQGEFFYSVNPIEDTLALVVPTMSLVKQFVPKVSDFVKQQKSKKIVDSAGKAVKTSDGGYALTGSVTNTTTTNFNAVDLFSIFQDLYKLTSAQTRAYYFFKALYKSKALFSVETSWERYDNMVLKSMIPMRDNSLDISDYTLTFQQINFTQSLVVDLKNKAGRTRQQLAQTQNKGTQKGTYTQTVPST